MLFGTIFRFLPPEWFIKDVHKGRVISSFLLTNSCCSRDAANDQETGSPVLRDYQRPEQKNKASNFRLGLEKLAVIQ